ncbi:MAG TPA: hypothetical protein VFP41_03820 [Actinomycetota bacterium]|nr:hypothetical protein [Actinomycetota bacterium]
MRAGLRAVGLGLLDEHVRGRLRESADRAKREHGSRS